MELIEESLHFLLMKGQGALAKKLYQELSGAGLTPGQPKILDFLAGHDGCIQKKLAAACELESATVTNLLARMESAGLIRRETDSADRRVSRVFLTAEGAAASKTVRAAFHAVESRAFRGFPPERRTAFLAMLQTVYHNLKDC